VKLLMLINLVGSFASLTQKKPVPSGLWLFAIVCLDHRKGDYDE